MSSGGVLANAVLAILLARLLAGSSRVYQFRSFLLRNILFLLRLDFALARPWFQSLRLARFQRAIDGFDDAHIEHALFAARLRGGPVEYAL